MAKKFFRAATTDVTITSDRAARLFLMISLIGERPQKREHLLRRLGVGLRDFYRDLEVLRKAGIEVSHMAGNYSLPVPVGEARHLLPFPNPYLTLGEAEILAKGRSTVHRKIVHQVEQLTGSASRKSRRA